MKFSDLDSRPLANKGVECKLYDPKMGDALPAGIFMLGADSTTAKNKWKEIFEKHRLEGKKVSPDQSEDDAKEVLCACAVSWHDIDDDSGKPFPFNQENMRALLEVPEIYKQVADFHSRRANFLPSASAS